jgi:hypothetical protein
MRTNCIVFLSSYDNFRHYCKICKANFAVRPRLLSSGGLLSCLSSVVIVHSHQGTVIVPRVAIDNPSKVKNIILMGTVAQNFIRYTAAPGGRSTFRVRDASSG